VGSRCDRWAAHGKILSRAVATIRCAAIEQRVPSQLLGVQAKSGFAYQLNA
jgi:hypothetical protein